MNTINTFNFLETNQNYQDLIQEKKYKKLSITSNIDNRTINNEAIVLKGTFSLKERIQTLETYKNELVDAKSTKSRIKRVAIVLLSAAIIAALVAAIVFGGQVGIVVGELGLLISTAIGGGLMMTIMSDEFPDSKVFSEPNELNAFICLLGLPIVFGYYIATYESRRANNVSCCENEVKEIADFVQENKDMIEEWFNERLKEAESLKEQELNKLKSCTDSKKIDKINSKIQTFQKDIESINSYKERLNNSLEEANRILNQE